jgi:hypothetical protein
MMLTKFLQLELNVNQSQSINIKIYTITGVLRLNYWKEVDQSNPKVEVDITTLKKGNYKLQIDFVDIVIENFFNVY